MIKLSLTFRLTAIFTLLITLTGAAISSLLYGALNQELVQRDEQVLINRASQLRHLLLLGNSVDALPLYFNHMLDPHQDMLAIQREEGEMLVNDSQALQLPPFAALKGDQVITSDKIHRWRTPNGIEAQAIRLNVETPQGHVTLTVARQALERTQILSEYRSRSLHYLLSAILAGGLMSPWLTRRGLSSLHRLSAITATTRSDHLHQPVEMADLPQELQPLVQAMNTMRQQLNDDFARITQFADDLAHEIRTPINILSGQNQVALTRPRSSAEYQQLISSNIDELEKLSHLTKHILFLARSQQGAVNISRSDLALSVLVHQMVEYLEPLAEERGINLRVTGKAMISADRLLMQRALENLLINAIRYAPIGSAVTVSLQADAQEKRMIVSNHGEPLLAADKMFERFWRGDNARHTSGTGLGLALVRSIAELHGGRVEYWHAAGINHFCLSLPDAH